jgi:hypothetical protein
MCTKQCSPCVRLQPLRHSTRQERLACFSGGKSTADSRPSAVPASSSDAAAQRRSLPG